ncbi:GIY-YIG nuclease family protein [Bradyrhizobium sp. SZCCHNR1020]|uniref:GIY-YIG nuclease family protein n=1 Tax=Bradyrhizobium sp. SZCCHNR1020 TaxID=3057343 RepID=UPI002915D327|nr:GIY-YIG nuclease family protein [Bradyrhizobium sp. SZCCHNR1020]
MRGICGIYIIECVVTGEKYVGSSEDVHRRWIAHRSRLNRGLHHSKLLQARWDEFGPDAFRFDLIAIVEPCALLRAERDQIASGRYLFNAAFPMANPMKGRRHTPISIALMKRNRAGIVGPTKKGDKRSKDFGEKVSRAKKGKTHKGRQLSAAEAAKATARLRAVGNGHWIGRRHSDVAREKMKAAAALRDQSMYRRGSEHPQFGRPSWNRGIAGPKGSDAFAAKSIEVDGVEYGCAADAAAALKVSLRTFYNYRNRGLITVKSIESRDVT